MTVSSCPSCHESVTVPVNAQADAIVRCPLCQEQFQLKEFLAQLPPPLIVLSPAGSPQESATDTGTSAEADASIFPQSDASSSAPQVPAFDFFPESAPREENVGVDSSYTTVRRQKNPSIEIAKVVAGGLLALPLAQLILWWLPGKWQRDPLQIGPSVGRVVPWVVPENFRSAELTVAPNEKNETASSATHRRGAKGTGPGRAMQPRLKEPPTFLRLPIAATVKRPLPQIGRGHRKNRRHRRGN